MNNLNFDEVSYQAFLNAATDKYDFATCQRPDGSKYGTGGQCRKGTPTTPGSDDKKTSSKKSSGGSGDGVGTGKPSSSVKSGGIGEMTIKTKDDMKKMSDGELKDHMKLANKVAFQNDVSKLTKAQFNGLADQHKMAKAELESRKNVDVNKKVEANNRKVEQLRKQHRKLPWGDKKKSALMEKIDKINGETKSLLTRSTQGPQQRPQTGGAAAQRRARAASNARD